MTSGQRDLINEIAAERGLSMGAFVRGCVRAEVEKTGRVWPKTRLEAASQARVRQLIEKEKTKKTTKHRDTDVVKNSDVTADGRYDARPRKDSIN